jgi:hypothetical protein
MGKVTVALSLLLATLFGCKSTLESPTTRALKGRHKLHELVARAEGETKPADSFFLFSDDFGHKEVSEMSVKFSWQTSDGSFAVTALPLSKIKIKVDGRTNTPTVSFEWEEPLGKPQLAPQELMDRAVTSATIYIQQKADWPPFVHAP